MSTEKKEIIFAGVGGQGLVSCGNILGEAASSNGMNAVMTTAYGVETRGTFAKSDLIVSNQDIDYPEVLHPDAILALAQEAYLKYAESAPDGMLLIYDQDAVTPTESRARQLGFPITATAEAMGNATSANILALGILLGEMPLLDIQCVTEAIRRRFGSNAKAVEKNLALLNKGLEMAREKTA